MNIFDCLEKYNCDVIPDKKFKIPKDIKYLSFNKEYSQDANIFYYKTPNFKYSNIFVCFDLDWTLVRPFKSLYPKDEYKLLPFRFEVLNKLYKKGFTIIIMTNQKTKGYKSYNLLLKRLNSFKELMKNIPYILIASLKEDFYRKPNKGMYSLIFDNIFSQNTQNILRKNTQNILRKNTQNILSIYVGDSAGRSSDRNDSDKEFGKNFDFFFTQTKFFPQITINKIKTEISNKKVVLMMGMQGSGKSTLSNKLKGEFIVIHKDKFKNKNQFLNKIKEEYSKGKKIIIDATNASNEERDNYFDILNNIYPLQKKDIFILYKVGNGYNYNKIRTTNKVPDIAYYSYFKRLEEPNYNFMEIE